MKSITIWINQGGNNTKFFHKYAEHRKNINSIWELSSNRGKLYSHKELHESAMAHFEMLFKDLRGNNILHQLNVVQNYPIFFNEDEGRDLFEPILRENQKDLEQVF